MNQDELEKIKKEAWDNYKAPGCDKGTFLDGFDCGVEALQKELDEWNNIHGRIVCGLKDENKELVQSYSQKVKNIQKELNEAVGKKISILKYCINHHEYMWASQIMGLILNCDFRESNLKAKEFLAKIKRG